MNIGDLILVRNGGAYGLYHLNDSKGEILKSGTSGILLEKVSIKNKGYISGIRTDYYTIYCKISIGNTPVWLPEGSIQQPGRKILWGYIKKYKKNPL